MILGYHATNFSDDYGRTLAQKQRLFFFVAFTDLITQPGIKCRTFLFLTPEEVCKDKVKKITDRNLALMVHQWLFVVYVLPPWSKFVLEKPPVAKLVTTPATFYGTDSALRCSPLVFIFCQMNPLHILTTCLFNIYFDTILLSMHGSSKIVSFLQVSPTKILCVFFIHPKHVTSVSFSLISLGWKYLTKNILTRHVGVMV